MKRLSLRIGAAIVIAMATSSAGRADQASPEKGVEALQRYADTLSGEQREAAEFLIQYLPEMDRESLPVDLFRENLEQAYVARETYPWTKRLPKEIFFNDVLPYAVASETRDAHRKLLREKFHPLLDGADAIEQAVDAVGGNIAELTGVKYDTTREKACQSPAESIRQGKASCTGLSILMVDALRAVGVPCRLAAIVLWGTKEGNHTWVEVYDGENWRKMGWAEGHGAWDGGWEIPRCAYCDPMQPIHCVFASSYRDTGLEFPMIWEWRMPRRASEETLAGLYQEERNDRGELTKLAWSVQPVKMPGVDRTSRYLELAGGRKIPIPPGQACIAVKAYEAGSDRRVAVPVRVYRGDELLFEGQTANNSQDLNDYVRLITEPKPVRIEYQDDDGNWTSRETQGVADQVTEVRIEL